MSISCGNPEAETDALMLRESFLRPSFIYQSCRINEVVQSLINRNNVYDAKKKMEILSLDMRSIASAPRASDDLNWSDCIVQRMFLSSHLCQISSSTRSDCESVARWSTTQRPNGRGRFIDRILWRAWIYRSSGSCIPNLFLFPRCTD